MSKAKKTTTGWRQRYLVTVDEKEKTVEVLLLRGRLRKADNGDVTGLVSHEKYKGWRRRAIDTTLYPWITNIQTRMYEGVQRPELVGYVSGLRITGYTIKGEVPSW